MEEENNNSVFENYEIKQADSMERHRPISEEDVFFNAVAQGNLDIVQRNCEARRFADTKGVGKLSRDPVQNQKYHLVITAALMTRKCIREGMIEEQAYRMSDYYLQQLDDLHTTAEIEKLHDDMVLDFTGKMRSYNPHLKLSAPTQSAVNYIYIHITEAISVDRVADAVGVSAGYLSRIFKRETGVSVSEYIRQKKIETAANLLKYSPYSMVEIANRLSFSSQSHFIQTFKREIGMTPLKYREKYGGSEWNVSENQYWL